MKKASKHKGVNDAEMYGYGGVWVRVLAHVVTVVLTSIPYVGFLALLYHIVSYIAHGKGLGYSLLGLQIVNKDTKEKPHVGMLLLRAVYKYIFIIVFWIISFVMFVKTVDAPSEDIGNVFFWIITVLAVTPIISVIYLTIIGTSDKKRGPHDSWTNTVVIKDKEKIPVGMLISSIVISLVGILVFVGMIITIVFSSLNGVKVQVHDAQQISYIQQMNIKLLLDQDTDGNYPTNPELLPGITWLDNTEDQSRYCMFTELSGVTTHDYYVVNQESSSYTSDRPTSINDCLDGVEL